MDASLTHIWAKTDKHNAERWHPLILHMLDVAATADAILSREPAATQKRMGATLGMSWDAARPWILMLVGCHDLGKACPGFQAKWPELLPVLGLDLPRVFSAKVHHAFVSQLALATLLREIGWPDDLADLAADAVGCHHGIRSSEQTREPAEQEIYVGSGAQSKAVREAWNNARKNLFAEMLQVLKPKDVPSKPEMSGPEFMMLAGLTSFADWIGSDQDLFSFGTPGDCNDLAAWFTKRRALAEHALDRIRWFKRTPILAAPKSFHEIFGFSPRPLQDAVAKMLDTLLQPSVLLVEGPMGEGKTEAAFYAHLDLQRRFGHRGLYIALPTQATGNAMFERTLHFLRSQGSDRDLDLQLIHGGVLLNDTFQSLRISNVYDIYDGGDVRAGEWFTNKKRALLSEYGVGTIDQILLPILPVKHNFVRLWGLANRVIVFDEIHAYDAYTGTLLLHLVRWLLSLGSSVVLLSATLAPSTRKQLAKLVGSILPAEEAEYPRISIFRPDCNLKQVHFAADEKRRLEVRLQAIPADLAAIHDSLDLHLCNGGMALALLNTVQRAQDLYMQYPAGEAIEYEGRHVGKWLADGTEIYLFHARFPAEQRQVREKYALFNFNKSKDRTGRKILIATQVAEQSLDLDFDVIATDLAPIDLILQRAGRLWRHDRGPRRVSEPVLLVAGLKGEKPPSFGQPLWWEAVYREDVLLRTWILLRERLTVVLPHEIDTLVQDVYEKRADVPAFIEARIEKAGFKSDGEALAQRGQANLAIIGFPDDASWNDPGRIHLYDEDDPLVHYSLRPQTRLGENAIVVVPLYQDDSFLPTVKPDFLQENRWYMRALSISRLRVVGQLQKQGVPEGWKQSALLRNCFPLVLDSDARWIEDATVRLDEDLGLVYESKEAQ